jgi:hypothetical protein
MNHPKTFFRSLNPNNINQMLDLPELRLAGDYAVKPLPADFH